MASQEIITPDDLEEMRESEISDLKHRHEVEREIVNQKDLKRWDVVGRIGAILVGFVLILLFGVLASFAVFTSSFFGSYAVSFWQ